MELRHLKYFVTVAENLHFGRAAKLLRIAQPVLSRRIMQMESEMEVRLFERNKRSVRLTHAGALFLGSARRILAQTDVAIESARRAAAGRLGLLRIACGPVTTHRILPEILELVRERFPEVDLHVSHAPTPDQVSSLLSNDIDVGFVIPPLESSGLRTCLLLREPLVVALPQHHRLSKKKHLRLLDLKNESFVFPLHREEKAGLYAALESICNRAGFIPKIVHEAYPIQTMLALVASGSGISLVPESVQHFTRANVTFIPITDRCSIEFMMVSRRSETSPVVTAFVDLVTKHAMKKSKKLTRSSRSRHIEE